MEILKQSNIEETTEFSVRVAASERLGIDLSDPHRKQLVRNVVESYLLTVAAEDAATASAAVDKPPEPQPTVPPEEPRESAVQLLKPKREVKEDSDRVICQVNPSSQIRLGTKSNAINSIYE